MLDKFNGNKYARWADFLAHSGATPFSYRTTGTCLHPLVMIQINKRLEEAIEKNDTAEIEKLKRLYVNSNIADFIFEEPVPIKGGYKFCYINRKAGFLYPDQVLADKKFTLRELLANSGMTVHKPTTINEMENINDGNSEIPAMIDLSELGYDVIGFSYEGMQLQKAFGLLEKTGLTGMSVLNWADTSFVNADQMGEDEELVQNLYGAIEIKSPILEGGVAHIPITGLSSFVWMVAPTPPGRKHLTVVQNVRNPITFLINYNDEDPKTAGPASAPITQFMYDGVKLTGEELNKIKFNFYSTNDLSGNVSPTWMDDGGVQLSFTAYYNKDNFEYKFGRYTSSMLCRITYQPDNEPEAQGWAKIGNLIITGFDSDNRYEVGRLAPDDDFRPGSKLVYIARYEGEVKKNFYDMVVAVNKVTGETYYTERRSVDQVYELIIHGIMDTTQPIDVFYDSEGGGRFKNIYQLTVFPEAGNAEPVEP